MRTVPPSTVPLKDRSDHMIASPSMRSMLSTGVASAGAPACLEGGQMTTSPTTSPSQAETLPALSAIHHVGLTVCDVEASTTWYQRVLGLRRWFEESHHHSDQGGFTVV